MGELIDKMKGKAKEAVGSATGNRKLEAEGEFDQAKGNVKGAAEDAKQRVKELVRDEEEREDRETPIP